MSDAKVRVEFAVIKTTEQRAWLAVEHAHAGVRAAGLAVGMLEVRAHEYQEGVKGELEVRQWGALQTVRAFAALVRAQLPAGSVVVVSHLMAGMPISS